VIANPDKPGWQGVCCRDSRAGYHCSCSVCAKCVAKEKWREFQNGEVYASLFSESERPRAPRQTIQAVATSCYYRHGRLEFDEIVSSGPIPEALVRSRCRVLVTIEIMEENYE